MSMERKKVSLTLTTRYIERLDHLVKEGLYMERQAAIREGLRLLFELHGVPLDFKGVKV